VVEGLPEARALLRELADFRVSIPSSGHENFGAAQADGHDDLVLASALAAWIGELDHQMRTS
jgi:hypothetical protein